jgi:hypothetical protein
VNTLSSLGSLRQLLRAWRWTTYDVRSGLEGNDSFSQMAAVSAKAYMADMAETILRSDVLRKRTIEYSRTFDPLGDMAWSTEASEQPYAMDDRTICGRPWRFLHLPEACRP